MIKIRIIVFFLVIVASISCFAKFDMERDNLEDAIPKGMTRQNMKILKQKNAKDFRIYQMQDSLSKRLSVLEGEGTSMYLNTAKTAS